MAHMRDASGQNCAPPPAESSPIAARGRLQRPHTAQGAGRISIRPRVLTLKLDPTPEQYNRLRELAWQAMQYKNAFIRARWAEAIGLRVDPSAGDPHDLSKHIRKTEKGELSGSAYSAAERECQALWSRDGRRILAGAPLPQFRQADSLSVRGHKRREDSGARLALNVAGAYVLDLQVQAQTCEGGCWMRIPVAKGHGQDAWQGELLHAMTTGAVPILKAVLVFRFRRRRLDARLCYEVPVHLPPLGERVATLGPITPDGRLLLRTETDTLDYTSKLHSIASRKANWDGIRRRAFRTIGRRRGSARLKREVMAHNSFDDWCKTFLHQWSNEIVTWCAGQGVGRLVIAPIGDGDWPAHRFIEFLTYKGEDAGITVSTAEDASLQDASTARAATNTAKREQRKAKKLNEAVRTVQAALTEKAA